MQELRLEELFEKPMSGEWGIEPEENSARVNVIRTTNFTKTGVLNLDSIVIRNIDIEKYAEKILRSGDLIIEKSGGSPAQPVGRVVLFEGKEDIWMCNNFTSILRPKKNNHPQYLLYMMVNIYNQRKVLNFQNKTTGIINLKLNDYLKSISVIIPHIKVQVRIANILDRSQELINKRKEQAEACDELIKSLFFEMFGDPQINDKNHKKHPLKEIAEIITGNTPPRENVGNYGSHVEWIKSDNINTKSHYLTKAEEYLSVMGIARGRCVESGAILMTCIAGSRNCIGNIALTDRKVAFNQQINGIRPYKNCVLAEFLYTQFILAKTYIQNASTNSMKGMVSKGALSNLEFIVPNIDEQQSYVNAFKKIEHQKQLFEKSLVKLENNFNALMQKAFKGELF